MAGTGMILVGENPLRYVDAETGAAIPVRYYVDADTDAVVAFVIIDKRAWIVQMRVGPGDGKDAEPMADKAALKAAIGVCDINDKSAALKAEDISRIEASMSLTARQVK